VYTVDNNGGVAELAAAYGEAKTAAADRPAVVVVRTNPAAWTESGAWWEVGVPEVADREEVRTARADIQREKHNQVRYLGG
jgi:3D-(3,5/4)-trihydroxycyclohexane-1,2-dione acylhydrolase (decyclizing)